MTNLPISGIFRITAAFGQTGRYWRDGHKGIDIVCQNRDIYATCDGTVRVVSYDPAGWGCYISVGDSAGNKHIFCHLEKGSICVSPGQKVTRLTRLARMGSTGNSTGTHLHYQINDKNNAPINPCPHLGIPNEKGTYNSDDYKIQEEKDMTFKDHDTISKWAREAVENVSDAGIMLGDDKGNFNPKAPLTRQEMAVILNRLISRR